MSKPVLAFCATLAAVIGVTTAGYAAPFKVFMISSTASDHLAMSAAARTALPKMGLMNDFTVDATTDPSLINETNLAQYQVFLSMHLAPFEVPLAQRAAFEHFVQQGKGWVGVHAAGLIIPSEYPARNLPTWDFYANLMGGATYVVHPALQMGTIVMEDRTHPATKNMPPSFQILDEWYEWSKNPRPAVRVLGKADEGTYRQVKPMGDHPMIWSCELYPRAIYISTGHDQSDWNNPSYTILIRDALLWAAGTPATDAGSDAPTGSRDGSQDAPSSTDGGADASEGAGGSASAGAAGAAGAAGGAGSMVSAGGAGGGLSGSGGAGGQATGGMAGSTSSTSATGSGGSSGAGGGGVNGSPADSSSGCSCRLGRVSSSDAWRPSALLLVGLALASRRRPAKTGRSQDRRRLANTDENP